VGWREVALPGCPLPAPLAHQNLTQKQHQPPSPPKNRYFLPRPLRLAFFGGSALSCAIATLLSATRLLSQLTAPDPLLAAAGAGGGLAGRDVIINLIGCAVFAALFIYDRRQQDARVERRRVVREKQIAFGDREVFTNDDGQRMSRLKEVDADWILRRLERWGRRDGMPFVGPQKAALLRGLVGVRGPRVAVEVGAMAGYSAICIAQVGWVWNGVGFIQG